MIYFAQPVYRSLSLRTASSIQKVLASVPAGEKVIWEPYWGDALIARARSVQATRFLEDYLDCDVMVMVDDDIVFTPDAFWRIVQGARDTKGIYAGAYVTHGDKPHLTCREWPGQPAVKIHDGGLPDPVWVEYTATGFMAVHRDVISQLAIGEYEDADCKKTLHRCVRGSGDKPMIPFFDCMTTEEAPGIFHWLSEDWAFCERANQQGFKCYIDQSIKLEHMGTHGQTVDDMEGTGTGAGIGTETVEVSVMTTGDPVIDNLPDDIAEFTGQPVDLVLSALPEGSNLVAKLWEDWKGTEEAFYSSQNQGPAYALDLAWWHMHAADCVGLDTYPTPLTYAEDLKDKRFLDVGAGIGTFSLAAARAGAEVFIAEPNPWMTEFVLWRGAKYGYKISSQPSGIFDTILCWHVLEHVKKPEIMLSEIHRSLAPGGTLILQADFHADHSHPMHHEMTMEEYDTMVEAAGFTRISRDIYQKV